jgi:triosephosphate isomerase
MIEVDMRRKLVAGNWKMNGSTLLVDAFCQRFQAANFDSEVLLIPPYLYIPSFQLKKADSVKLGVQNLSSFAEGAYTGEISASMAEEFKVEYSLFGHSERRQLFNETDQIVADKILLTLSTTQIKPILCVGETLEERESGEAFDVVRKQLRVVFDTIVDTIDLRRLVIAYEPVWAIGTGVTATPGQAQDMHAFIRKIVSDYNVSVSQEIRLLYGGSVNLSNAVALFGMQDIDGALIGGASLKVDDFFEICKLAN